MKIKRSLLQQGNLIDEICKVRCDELRQKAERLKLHIDAKAAKGKEKVDKRLLKQLKKQEDRFARLRAQRAAKSEVAAT